MVPGIPEAASVAALWISPSVPAAVSGSDKTVVECVLSKCCLGAVHRPPLLLALADVWESDLAASVYEDKLAVVFITFGGCLLISRRAEKTSSPVPLEMFGVGCASVAKEARHGVRISSVQ